MAVARCYWIKLAWILDHVAYWIGLDIGLEWRLLDKLGEWIRLRSGFGWMLYDIVYRTTLDIGLDRMVD